MKQDIRNLFKQEVLQKKKLPDSHRIEFLGKLNEQKKNNLKKKGFGFVFKIAAAIVLLIGLGFFLKNDRTLLPVKTNELVNQPIDTTIFKQERLFDNVPIKEMIVLENVKSVYNEVSTKVDIDLKNRQLVTNQEINFQQNDQKSIIADTAKETEENIEIAKSNTPLSTIRKDTKPQIKVNSKALLYSVTHSANEVLAYYKENNLTRESVIASIEEELIKSELNIDANTLLTEIEIGLKGYSFKEKLLAKIKLKLKELSNAIATN